MRDPHHPKASTEGRILLEDSYSTDSNTTVTFYIVLLLITPDLWEQALFSIVIYQLTYDGEMPLTFCHCRLFILTGMGGQYHNSMYCFDLKGTAATVTAL